MNNFRNASLASRGGATAARAACVAEFIAARNTRLRRCPSCGGIVFSRRFATCRDCGAPLPASLRQPAGH